MDYLLDFVEVRVLGALIEKQILTPDYYPLTLNSLLNACNQKTARNPVTDYGENELTAAIEGLCEKGFVVQLNIAGSRTIKFRHRMDNFAELLDKEIALLCILMLRGPQTAGELRQRTERLYSFADLAETEETLKELMDREEPEPLVAVLPLAPGCKEKRYVHLFSDIPASHVEAEAIVELPKASPSQVMEKIQELESVVENIKNTQEMMEGEIQTLKENLEVFKQQFE